MLLGAIVIAYIVKKVVADSIIDHDLAKQGKVPPRLQAKYGPKAAAKVAQYGFTDYLRDAWHDYWPRRTEALIAARNAKDEARERGESVGFRQRLAHAREVIERTYHRVVDPVEPKPPAAAEPEPEPAGPGRVTPLVDSPDPDIEPGTRRIGTGGQWEQWDGTRWTSVVWPDPPPTPEPAVGTHQQDTTRGAPAMTAPTGEVVNYETAVAQLHAQMRDLQSQIDAAQAVVRSTTDAKAAVDQMQETYRQTAEAAQSKLDHEAALNLDSTTLGHAGTQVDSLPPSAVDSMFEHLEQVEAEAKERLAHAETALAATEAELRHLQATYGDAHSTVASNLGGDSRFLDSGGATPTGGGPVGGFTNSRTGNAPQRAADEASAQQFALQERDRAAAAAGRN